MPETLKGVYTGTLVAKTYHDKRELLAQACEDLTRENPKLLSELGERLCSPPFPTQPQVARLWITLWPALTPEARKSLTQLPDPCLNHLEDRMRREERARRLTEGCLRLVEHDVDLFLEGVRLHPHALCRAAEALGPIPDDLWEETETAMKAHRLWRVAEQLSMRPISGEAFWTSVETLQPHRELPQLILDFLESGRSQETASVEEFQLSLERFLIRSKLEKVRFFTYSALKGLSNP